MIKFHKMHSNAVELRHGSQYSAGIDIASAETVRIPPGTTAKIRTGWRYTVNAGEFLNALYFRIAPRSGVDTKRLLSVCAGVCDADYQGEVIVALHNRGTEDQVVERGEYIAQLIAEVAATAAMLDDGFIEGVAQSYRVRGADGFGSTDDAKQ